VAAYLVFVCALFECREVCGQQTHALDRATTGTGDLTNYRGADKSLARPGRKQATATEGFDFHISYL
jgi:hypothetical protein